MGTLWSDLRYALRTLAHRPGFTVVAALTLALGIGANSAIFSVVNAVLLRPLPYPEPERLVVLEQIRPNGGTMPLSPPDFVDFRDQSRSFEALAVYNLASPTLNTGAEPEQLQAALVSASFFPMLGISAQQGRVFLPEEERQGSHRVALLGHGLWQRRFGGRADVVGQSFELDGKTYSVAGVLSEGFAFPDRNTELWLPLSFTDEELSEEARDAHYLPAIARIKSGVSIEAAGKDVETIAARLAADHPERHTDLGARVRTLHEATVGDLRPALLVLLGAVALVLLIACANLANLLLARASGRHREIAVRTALGASRLRLVRQLLTESLVLGLAGGALGLLMAFWGVDLLKGLSPADTPRLSEIGMDVQVLGYTFLLAVLTGLGFGLVPALSATRPDLAEALKEGGTKASAGRHQGRTRGALVVAEIALALLLLVGAGLMLESFLRLRAVDPGFDPSQLLTFSVSRPDSGSDEAPPASVFFDAALERLAALPGVQSAAAIAPLPYGGNQMILSVAIAGRVPETPNERLSAEWRGVSASYFQTMRMRLLDGRLLAESDIKDAPPVLVINETMARRFWPQGDALGKRVTIGFNSLDCEIVGIVSDTKASSLDAAAREEMYTSYRQTPLPFMDFVLRGTADPSGLTESARRAVLAVDPAQPIYGVRLMEERLDDSVAQERFQALLLTAFAAVALTLAVIGIYAVMAIAVTQRTRELGIRMALGARPRDVVLMVLGQGMALALAGVLIGVGLALALTRLLSSLLYGVSPTDPGTMATVAILLVSVALLACLIPARRAARVDPMEALHHD